MMLYLSDQATELLNRPLRRRPCLRCPQAARAAVCLVIDTPEALLILPEPTFNDGPGHQVAAEHLRDFARHRSEAKAGIWSWAAVTRVPSTKPRPRCWSARTRCFVTEFVNWVSDAPDFLQWHLWNVMLTLSVEKQLSDAGPGSPTAHEPPHHSLLTRSSTAAENEGEVSATETQRDA